MLVHFLNKGRILKIIVGVSSQAAGHKTLVPELVLALKKMGLSCVIVVGGVIPQQDYDFLYQSGVDCIFGPGYIFQY
jgi:methylmalonyl-CoA mutase